MDILYAVAMRAHRGQQHNHAVTYGLSEDDQAAKDAAWKWVIETHPPADGWQQHNVVVIRVDDETVHAAAAALLEGLC